MTLLSRIFERRSLTPAQIWGKALDDWYASGTAAGVSVTVETALQLPVVRRCINLLIDDIAQLPVHAHRGEGGARETYPKPDWFERPTADPNYGWVEHVGDVLFSLLTDGNAFIACFPNRVSPQMVLVLEPDKVEVKTTAEGVTYLYRNPPETAEYTGMQILHIRLAKSPGKERADSPIHQMRETIGLGLAAEEYGARFFSNGAILSGIIEMPTTVGQTSPMRQDLIEDMRKGFEARHMGKRKSHAIGILSGGATWKPISTNASESQLLELKQAVVEDVARGYGIPPYMVGSTQSGAVAYASTSNARIDYVVHTLMPLVNRLERAYSHLIPETDVYIKFNLNALLRGDQRSRYDAYHVGLQDRFLMVDEVRAYEDLPPLGGANGGLLNTPNNSSPQPNAEPTTPVAPSPADDLSGAQ